MGRRTRPAAASGPAALPAPTPTAPEPPPAPTAPIESKSALLLASLTRFYEQPGNFEQFSSVVLNEAGISLRILDHLVTNYAIRHNLFLVRNGKPYNLYREYKSQLDGYQKRFFDPFCRRERAEFRGLHTTLGQLNFFRWAIEEGVLAYGLEHEREIDADMMDAIRQRLESKNRRAPRGDDHDEKARRKAKMRAARAFTKTDLHTTLTFS